MWCLSRMIGLLLSESVCLWARNLTSDKKKKMSWLVNYVKTSLTEKNFERKMSLSIYFSLFPIQLELYNYFQIHQFFFFAIIQRNRVTAFKRKIEISQIVNILKRET